MRFYVLFICVFFLYSFGFFLNDKMTHSCSIRYYSRAIWLDEEIWGAWPQNGQGHRGIFFNEMFVFLIIQDDFKKLIKLVENWQNMTQTFQREKIDGEKKKLKLKMFGVKENNKKSSFFCITAFFFRFFECLVFF